MALWLAKDGSGLSLWDIRPQWVQFDEHKRNHRWIGSLGKKLNSLCTGEITKDMEIGDCKQVKIVEVDK